MEERLQKILARAGYGSRRSCEELITAGRVQVNGKKAELGSKADPATDQVRVDGKTLPKEPPKVYIALNKPQGVLSDEDEMDTRPTVRGMVPLEGHLFTVGRLDLDSEGLILLTNDGDLANHLTHPRYGHEKEYKVQVMGRPDDEQLSTWRRGVVMDDGYKTAPAGVEVINQMGDATWLKIILHEGKKRQIREVGKLLGLPVRKILRVRIGTLRLGVLKPGEWRHLTSAEVRDLKNSVSDKPRKTSVRRSRPQATRSPRQKTGRA